MSLIQVCVPAGVARLDEVFCRCGSPESAWAAVHQELRRLAQFHQLPHERLHSRECHPEQDSGEWYVLVYLLDHLNLTEHGGNVMWAWLTPDGTEVLNFLEQWGAEWLDDLSVEFVNGEGTLLNALAAVGAHAS